jgi:hypothetical protein
VPASSVNLRMPERKRPKTNGVVRLSESEFLEFFDRQARHNLNMSGIEAMKRIRAGRAGSNLAWTELVLLSTLLAEE